MKVCEQHKTTPALIYGECIGCELGGLRADVKRLKSESDQILNDAIANIDRKAERIKNLETALSGRTYCHSGSEVEAENKRQRESLIWSVCRLYDTELITGSRACELLDGIKVQEFRELYTKWQESV